MPVRIISSSRFKEHVTPPAHPERAARAEVFSAITSAWIAEGGAVHEPRPATEEELSRAHQERYLDLIRQTAGKSSMLDADTFTSPESYNVALLAAGATVEAVQIALATRETTFALVRPPGHHAERDKAMGFCIYNNAAVAAAVALASGTRKIAIVDIDVHHGNGTQWIFYDDPRVLYISSHQYPFYPGTGAANETGHGAGMGYTINIPLDAGSNDDDYDFVYRSVAIPVLEQFAPELTLVSVGYDAHEQDPLAGMRMTAEGYARIIARLRLAAAKSGALALVTEGGYDLAALRECLQRTIAVLHADRVELPDDRDASPRGARALGIVRAAQQPFWRGLDR